MCGELSSGEPAALREHAACERCWGCLDAFRDGCSAEKEDKDGAYDFSEEDAVCSVCHGVVDVEDEEEAALERRLLCGALVHGACVGQVADPDWRRPSCK